MYILRENLISYLHEALRSSKNDDVQYRGITHGESIRTAAIRETVAELTVMDGERVSIEAF